MGVCVSSSGLIAVADRDNHRIQIFSRQGKWKEQFGKHGAGKPSHPWSVAISKDGVIFIGDYTLELKVYSFSGNFVRSIGPGLKFFDISYVSGNYVTMNCDDEVVLLAYIGLFSKNGELIWSNNIGFQHSRETVCGCDAHGNILLSPQVEKFRFLTTNANSHLALRPAIN